MGGKNSALRRRAPVLAVAGRGHLTDLKDVTPISISISPSPSLSGGCNLDLNSLDFNPFILGNDLAQHLQTLGKLKHISNPAFHLKICMFQPALGNRL